MTEKLFDPCQSSSPLWRLIASDYQGATGLASKCGKCELPGKLRCGGCQEAGYCSKECQRLGWEAGHKKFCSKEVEERKKKGNIEERWAEGANFLDNEFQKESVEQWIFDTKDLCKTAKAKKGSPQAQAQNETAGVAS